MRTIDNIEAEQRLDSLLDEVERGECIVITRGGTPIARLAPKSVKSSGSRMEVIAAIREFRKHMPRLSRDEIQSAIREGRRY